MSQTTEDDVAIQARVSASDFQEGRPEEMIEGKLFASGLEDSGLLLEDKIESFSKLEEASLLFFWFIVGCAVMLTWNAFLTNSEYFKLGFRSATLKRFFEPSMCICSMVPLLIGSFMNVGYFYRFSEFFRIVATKSITVLGFIVICVVAYVNVGEVVYFSTIMCLAFVLNFTTPIKSAALMVTVGYFSSSCFTSFMAGQAFAGLFVSITSLFIATAGLSPSVSSSIYFGISLFGITSSLLMYFVLVRTEVYKVAEREFMNMARSTSERPAKVPFKKVLDSYFKVCRKSKIECGCMFLNMLITLAIFPTVTIQVRSMYPSTKWASYFVLFHCFFLFGLGDFAGRYIPQFFKWPRYGSKWMLVVTCARAMFLPLFLMCTRQDSTKSVFPTVFSHDICPIVFMLLFSLSNGHLITHLFGVAFTYDSPRDMKAASHAMVLILGTGLTAGAAASFGTLLL